MGSRELHITLELPEEVVAQEREEALAAHVKEAFVMALLREHRLSQGKATEVLGISRTDLFARMTRYAVPVIDLTPDEVASELRNPLPHP
jgi:DNA-binding NtrC family response regulator